MSILVGEELRERVRTWDPPLVTPCADVQLQPNGVELTLAEVGVWRGAGRLGFDNADRHIPDVEPLPFDDEGWIQLPPGGYAVAFAETVNVHDDLCALARPRSSLLRMGVAVATALWDTGYRGRSRALLTVAAAEGIRLQRGARLIQLVFIKLPTPLGRGYEGAFQGEV
jgi:dUTP pyrophosphatase